MSSVGEAFKGVSIRGPGKGTLSKQPGFVRVRWERPAGDAIQVEVRPEKLDVAAMKRWVTDWAADFSTPGKLVYVTDQPGELEYSVALKDEDGKDEMHHGYGTEVRLGADPFSCAAENIDAADLPIVKEICRSLRRG